MRPAMFVCLSTQWRDRWQNTTLRVCTTSSFNPPQAGRTMPRTSYTTVQRTSRSQRPRACAGRRYGWRLLPCGVFAHAITHLCLRRWFIVGCKCRCREASFHAVCIITAYFVGVTCITQPWHRTKVKKPVVAFSILCTSSPPVFCNSPRSSIVTA